MSCTQLLSHTAAPDFLLGYAWHFFNQPFLLKSSQDHCYVKKKKKFSSVAEEGEMKARREMAGHRIDFDQCFSDCVPKKGKLGWPMGEGVLMTSSKYFGYTLLKLLKGFKFFSLVLLCYQNVLI